MQIWSKGVSGFEHWSNQLFGPDPVVLKRFHKHIGGLANAMGSESRLYTIKVVTDLWEVEKFYVPKNIIFVHLKLFKVMLS